MPRPEPYRRRQIRLPITMNAGLERLARERGVSVSALMRIAIAQTFFLGGDVTNTHTDATDSHEEESA